MLILARHSALVSVTWVWKLLILNHIWLRERLDSDLHHSGVCLHAADMLAAQRVNQGILYERIMMVNGSRQRSTTFVPNRNILLLGASKEGMEVIQEVRCSCTYMRR